MFGIVPTIDQKVLAQAAFNSHGEANTAAIKANEANKKGAVTFTKEEAAAIYELIDGLSGGNPENAFAHDGTDSMDDPTTSATVKLYKATGHGHLVPKNLR